MAPALESQMKGPSRVYDMLSERGKMGEAPNIRSSSHSKRWAQFRLDREQREFQTKRLVEAKVQK